jgi:FlaA1/EpsC-like NDP-sugar epimerase
MDPVDLPTGTITSLPRRFRRVLVTGGAGYVGSMLTAALLTRASSLKIDKILT